MAEAPGGSRGSDRKYSHVTCQYFRSEPRERHVVLALAAANRIDYSILYCENRLQYIILRWPHLFAAATASTTCRSRGEYYSRWPPPPRCIQHSPIHCGFEVRMYFVVDSSSRKVNPTSKYISLPLPTALCSCSA